GQRWWLLLCPQRIAGSTTLKIRSGATPWRSRGPAAASPGGGGAGGGSPGRGRRGRPRRFGPGGGPSSTSSATVFCSSWAAWAAAGLAGAGGTSPEGGAGVGDHLAHVRRARRGIAPVQVRLLRHVGIDIPREAVRQGAPAPGRVPQRPEQLADAA